jgi:hypothetical protein
MFVKSGKWRFLSSHVFPLAMLIVAALASPAWAPLERHATGKLVVFAAASLTEPSQHRLRINQRQVSLLRSYFHKKGKRFFWRMDFVRSGNRES